ncbi:MAG: serine/threonine protein kinase [Ruminococcus sp.]|nr:serine/threonine protein kinase [Ruminococcus sp.]
MLEIGQLIDGKYKILNKIGQGGMSVVYLAMNEKANKQWAIKEVRKDGTRDFNVVKKGLVAEIDMLKKLSHPNLPSIIDVIDSDDTFLIVMDYIEGNPLDKRLKEFGAQDQDDVIEWSKQLCDVLGYLHSRRPPIIYRDMKPSNVMLKPDGSVTLIDFGTAREFKYGNVEDTTCLGTRGYAAPEQFGGHGQTDARTDIYNLGATMYHLLTGHNPSTYPYEMYPIRQFNPMLSSGLEEIVLKCTQANPAERYQSCAELMYALENYQELDVENKKVQRFKWKIFLISAITCVVMALGTVGFKLLENMQTADTYDSYVKNAASQETIDEAFQYFENAINLQPENALAYNKMLEYIADDDVFTADESTRVIKLTGNLDDFRKGSPEEYAEFCYNLGIYYYFYYDSNNNANSSIEGMKKSATWFANAEDIEEFMNNSQDAELVKILHTMAKNSSGEKWGAINEKSGDVDADASYAAYWNDIETITDYDIAEMKNVSVALAIYKNFAITIKGEASEFAKVSGLTETDVLDRLNTMAVYVNEANLNKYESYNYEAHSLKISELEELIEEAKSAVSLAYNAKTTETDSNEQASVAGGEENT